MNYRHAYHAGNFADVMKHLTMVMCLDYLRQKDKGFCVIDAHGGCGLYNLHSGEAQKTGEYKEGIELLGSAPVSNPDLTLYLSYVRKDLAKGKYPGSPLIAARTLRDQDRLIAGELHPDDYKTLKMVMGSHRNVRIEQRDAYETLRTYLPPSERRGLILVDPPFEKRDEFEKLGRQAKQWAARFPTGIYLIWYPIKAQSPHANLGQTVADHFSDVLCFEAMRFPADRPEGLNGSGLLVVNPPFGLQARLETLAPVLQQNLTLHDCRINVVQRQTDA